MIYNEDCLEGMKGLPDKSVNLILCDLPFGTTDCNWDKIIPADKLWEQYERLITDSGVILLFASGSFVPKVMASNPSLYKYSWIWIKRNATNFVHSKNRPMTKHEMILVFSKAPMGHKSLLGDKRMTYNPQGLIPINKTRRSGTRRMGNIISSRPSHKSVVTQEFTNYPTDVLFDFPETSQQEKVHPNQKPVELLEYLIRTYSNEGEVVLDNCMGSGSTGVAALKAGREFIGFETNKKYFEIASQRLNCNHVITII